MVDKPKHSVRVTVIVDIEELPILNAAAEADERSLSGWMRRAALSAAREQAKTNRDLAQVIAEREAFIAERDGR